MWIWGTLGNEASGELFQSILSLFYHHSERSVTRSTEGVITVCSRKLSNYHHFCSSSVPEKVSKTDSCVRLEFTFVKPSIKAGWLSIRNLLTTQRLSRMPWCISSDTSLQRAAFSFFRIWIITCQSSHAICTPQQLVNRLKWWLQKGLFLYS